MEKEIEQIIRTYLEVRYKDKPSEWKSVTSQLNYGNIKQYVPDKEDALLALLLGVINRLDTVEKLLQEKGIDSK